MSYLGQWAPFARQGEPPGGKGPGTLWPLGFTAAQMARIFLRARHFRLDVPETEWSGSATYSGPEADSSHSAGPDQALGYTSTFPAFAGLPYDQETVPVSELAAYAELIGGEMFRSGGSLGLGEGGSYDTPTWEDVPAYTPPAPPFYNVVAGAPDTSPLNAYMDFWFELRGGYWSAYQVGELFYPRLIVYFSMQTGFAGAQQGPVVPGFWVSSPDGLPSPLVGDTALPPVTVSVFGHELELEGLYFADWHEHLGMSANILPTLPTSLSIGVAEYFTYGGRWNATTGARIGSWAG